jgi:integrase
LLIFFDILTASGTRKRYIMGISMVTPSRTKSGLWAARKAIPADVREAYGKREEKRTWSATLSEGQAKSAVAAWLAPIEARIASLRADPTSRPVYLTKRECRRIAGDWYQSKVLAEESAYTDRLLPFDWDECLGDVFPDGDNAFPGQRLRSVPGIEDDCEELLRERGLRVDADSRERLLQEMLWLWVSFVRLMRRRIAGDFGHDPVIDTLPPSEPIPATSSSAVPALSISGLFEDYAATGAASAHTVAKWRVAVTSFVDHAGHDDATVVTRAEVSAWLQSLVARGLAVKTVTGTYRAALARTLSLAFNNGRIPTNPAERMEVLGPKPTSTRRKGISNDEAKVILAAALGPQPDGITEQHALARRWVPWICAYTGSRISEVTQMRASDILKEDGVWAFRITPDAGSVKTGQFRLVPVHSHLIDQGVLKLANAGDDRPLFYDPAKARKLDAIQKQPQQRGSRLAQWIRGLGVTDVESPNHGWRHRWKTLSRLHGIDPEARDRLPGHAARTEGEAYGGAPLEWLKAEIEKLPRFDIGADAAPHISMTAADGER